MALTPKQQAFINEYMIDLNATASAIRAGYSAKTAKVIGYENLTKPSIAKIIEKALEQRTKDNGITADFVLNGIKGIALKDGIKESDTLKAFELLGKHLKLFTEKIEEKSDQTITIRLEGEAEEWSK